MLICYIRRDGDEPCPLQFGLHRSAECDILSYH